MGGVTGPSGVEAPSVIRVAPRPFTEAHIEAYAALTKDHNPIHKDPAFAARTPFGGTIVYGTLLLAPIWQAVEDALGRSRGLEGARAETKFTRPVRVGSSPGIEGRLVEGAALDGALRYELSVLTEGGEVAAVVDLSIPARR